VPAATEGEPDETKPADNGCGSTIAAGTLALLLAGGIVLTLRKKKEE
jgi:LPXTG-motif cell wall-anchored protein